MGSWAISTNPYMPILTLQWSWVITSTCDLEINFTSPENITIQDSAILYIPNGITLSVPTGNNIQILSGEGILIQSASKVFLNS